MSHNRKRPNFKQNRKRRLLHSAASNDVSVHLYVLFGVRSHCIGISLPRTAYQWNGIGIKHISYEFQRNKKSSGKLVRVFVGAFVKDKARHIVFAVHGPANRKLLQSYIS